VRHYTTNPVPVKTALAMMSQIEDDEVRLPLAPLSEANRLRLQEVLRTCRII
jgi:4-hydroxy-tetrahydrodipicolinate synthase